jgi:ribonuclease HI
MPKSWYAVTKGRTVGLFRQWESCYQSVRQFPGAKYRGFMTQSDATAWVQSQLGSDIEILIHIDHTLNTPVTETKAVTPVPRGVKKKFREGAAILDDSRIERTVVYTDGSCLHQGCSFAQAGGSAYFGPDDSRNQAISNIPGAQTSNRGEMWAVCWVLDSVSGECALEIRTDSQLTIDLATGRKDARSNIDILQKIWNFIRTRKGPFRFVKVKGHSGEPGNEAADKLAQKASEESTLDKRTQIQ